MKVTYCSYAIQEELLDKLYTKGNKPGYQTQTFNRAIIEGIRNNGVEIISDSNIPVSKALMDDTFKTVDNNDIYEYHPIINIPLVKDICILVSTYFKMKKRFKDKEWVGMGDILSIPNNLGAALAARYTNTPYVGIVTDVPELIETNKLYLWMINKVISLCTHYVFLTEPMNELINKEHKPYTIVEGLCSLYPLTHPERLKAFVYTGSLDEFNGTPALIDAFLKLDTDHELHFYGNGKYAEELKKICVEHSNIKYFGMIPHSEMTSKIQEASFLINPRSLSDPQIRYSFPSKTFDYLSSGTPMISTKLPCYTEEYKQVINFFDGDDVDSLYEGLKRMLDTDHNELLNKAAKARAFIEENKTNTAQAIKILDMLKG